MALEGSRRRSDGALIVICASALAAAAMLSHGGSPAGQSGADIDAAIAVIGAWVPHSLTPVANPDPEAAPQLARCRPYRVIATPDGSKAYVSLAGKEASPGSEVVVIDVRARSELRRVEVGSMPYGMTIDPSGRWLLVTNRFSNYITVLDVATDREVAKIPVPYYCEDVICSPDGSTAYASNFWKDQIIVVELRIVGGVLTGRMHDLGADREAFMGVPPSAQRWRECSQCDYRERWAPTATSTACPSCGAARLTRIVAQPIESGTNGARSVLRASCGTSGCHLDESGGFYAGADADRAWRSALAHSVPHDPDSSPLLLVTIAQKHGGWADALTGRHHPGGIVIKDPEQNPDYDVLREWIAGVTEGPGIAVGRKPRDLAISPDGDTLYVANTGSLDVSVVDLATMRETRRIFTRSPVNDIAWAGDRLMFATLGVGSGFPKERDPGRESLDREHPEAEFTLFRDLTTGKPLPLEQQQPLGPFDGVDGTKQEKFRDITNDVVILDPASENVAAYAATEDFTRYTSDSFEALPGDKRGDVAPVLMQVVGAFPEQIATVGRRAYLTMSGTFQVQEWTIETAAAPEARLVPGRVFETGFKPTGIAAAGSTLVIADHLSESVTFVDLVTGDTERLSVSRIQEPFPANSFELGEFFVQTSVFSADQDQSCVHCHYRDTSDGKKWSVSQAMGQGRDGTERVGGSREVPDLRGLVLDVPFFSEGTLTIDEPLTMMMEHNPLVDFQGVIPAGDYSDIFVEAGEEGRYAVSADAVVVATGRWKPVGFTVPDLIKRREIHMTRVASRWLGRSYEFREFQRFIGDYQAGEGRFLPNPEDPQDPMIARGAMLFRDPRVGCSGCHPAPDFTDKTHVYNQNRSFPPLVSPVARDNIHTLISADRIDQINGFIRPWDPEDGGRIEEREGFFVSPSLRGIWSRPQAFLHHGHALNARELICPPGHRALRSYPHERFDQDRPNRMERGLNELHGLPDTHGTTSHLTVWDVECLARFLNSIE